MHIFNCGCIASLLISVLLPLLLKPSQAERQSAGGELCELVFH